MNTTHATIVETIGYAALAKSLGVGRTAVHNAVTKGRFPPAWYLVVTELCSAHGIDAPPECFGMKQPEVSCLPPSPVNGSAPVQDGLPEKAGSA